MRILVSACLLGVNCTYRGDSNYSENIKKLKEAAQLIPVCPEILGGLPTPRKPSEIRGDKVVNCEGEDVSQSFLKGARETAYLAEFYDCKYALLKEKSPSCGDGLIYDGTFSHITVEGSGVTAKLLKQMGIKVYGESKIDELLEMMVSEEKSDCIL